MSIGNLQPFPDIFFLRRATLENVHPSDDILRAWELNGEDARNRGTEAHLHQRGLTRPLLALSQKWRGQADTRISEQTG